MLRVRFRLDARILLMRSFRYRLRRAKRNTMKNESKKHRFRAVAVVALALTLC